MDFEEVLSEHVGGCGNYQLLFHFLASSIAIVNTISSLEYGFIGATPKFWCDVTELQTFNFTQDEIEAFVSPPSNDDVTTCDACLMYSRNYSDVTEEDIATFIYSNKTSDVSGDLETTKCMQWTYDTSEYVDTVVTEVFSMGDSKDVIPQPTKQYEGHY